MKYKGFLLATTGGLAAMSGANAADLPTKAPKLMPAPVPVSSWTGFYAGLNVGAVWQMADGNYGSNTEGASAARSGYSTGFIGGGQIGYNWQFDPNWVFGLEGDISGLTGKVTAPAFYNTTKGNGFEGQITWLSTVRGRFGWLMHQDTMLYATGGLAVGGVKDTWAPNGVNSSCNPAYCVKSASKTKIGWTLGGGIEHILNPHWTVAVEALYVDLGETDASNIDGSKTSTFKNRAAIARLKVNYKF
jgi:outer membrane immunogenic protein